MHTHYFYYYLLYVQVRRYEFNISIFLGGPPDADRHHSKLTFRACFTHTIPSLIQLIPRSLESHDPACVRDITMNTTMGLVLKVCDGRYPSLISVRISAQTTYFPADIPLSK